MNLKLFLLSIFLFSFFAEAQEIDRVMIEGKITAPEGEDTEGITIYNVSAQAGTVTDGDGGFSLNVAENDRIYITAIQFQDFTVIVDKGVVDTKGMRIYLNPAINQLEEVIVRPYDLSGNIIADVKRIKTSKTTVDWDLSYESLEFGYEFTADSQTKVDGNAAEEALHGNTIKNGANILGIIGLLFPKKKKTVRETYVSKETITNALRRRFSNQYIVENFDIPEENVNEFIYYVEDVGVSHQMMHSENELELLEFLMEQSTNYKAQLKLD